ncbi:MAG: ABC transporter substrate-binding protein [Spirochaetaceae bacterium]
MRDIRHTQLRGAIIAVAAVGASMLLIAAGGQEGTGAPTTLTFSDMSWDSVRVHNRIVALILEHGYEGNYEFDYPTGSTVALAQGLSQGDNHVIMESWHNNWPELWEEVTGSGDVLDLGSNFEGAPQGWYVPTYIIEGDPERDIEPSAPDLRSIDDLPEYWELFKDPENPDKGRIMVGPPGWAITETNEELMEETGLTEYYTAFLPGSDSALKGSMEAAFRRGEPWLGYHWEPTWIMGKLDMTRLEDVGLPTGEVHKIVHKSVEEQAPELVELLERYETNLDQNNAFLAQMQDNEWDYEQAAEWFLREHEDTWTEWVSEDVAERVRAAVR